MKNKALLAAALSLAMVPCICLAACGDKTDPDGGNKTDGTTAAVTRLNQQVKGTNDTYSNIYARAERNGGLFNSSSQKSASPARYALAEDGNNVQTPDDSDGTDETGNQTFKLPDTATAISELYQFVKGENNYNFPNMAALKTYVIDVFTYTQVAQSISEHEKNESLAKTYSVDYDVDEQVYSNLTYGMWSTKVPEKISFAGYDAQSHKVNILFDAREPKDKENKVNNFEKVNSEMYYISDDDFGYAQFTYRYDNSGNHVGTGFDYFSMKDMAMLEINFQYGSFSNAFYNGMIVSFNQQQSETLKTYFDNLENMFTERTELLEQQNLALAKEAGIEGIETKTENGKTIYVKGNAEKPYKVSFDYSVLKKMLG